ncbi:MAG: TetR family transcriptional regulator [Peptoclostridium sp.]|uniref:TetR/AcrR family transcriptional regulator n=1 Tax=Peptoclostridium sp. TaxID=1904860 RepID=UPI00139E9008|nr:TetR/AcrR family transcriptional regulator [Peptoclostridium sp.]MZQ75489.1 TetR family transcriptional regulator [Peptoclostridium sp.]
MNIKYPDIKYHDFQNLETKERILKATLHIISQYGYENVTVRKVAQYANVNIALVNYHYGSKDNLLNEAMKQITLKLETAFNHLECKDSAAEERLKRFFDEYTSIIIEHPSIIKNFVFQTVKKSSIFIHYEEYFKHSGLRLLMDSLSEINPSIDKPRAKKLLFQAMAAISAPVLIAGKMHSMIDVDYFDPFQRADYLELLFDSLMVYIKGA